ncbi:hypothetical protein OK351_03410 [Glutamicibacter sp. MNS18]|uniref:hypothetical protein n=1 Tax=Glutamicibacter sp. MNS18 TaxID=2989817 RepID=UPI002235A3B0|nr:hypothetical protein [Glutamicibacter sp. MNS18]MCW4464554.1 hypothetical protein [Glutamicibacter sp. MNS18]
METNDYTPAARTHNTVSTPLYADGQVLKAEDLALGQTARDAEFARLRTMLHGWGVVAGLLPLQADGDLVISPGYGVLPGGGELYLPTPLSIPMPSASELARHCGEVSGACDLPAGDKVRPEAELGPLWLAVGAGGQPAEPRAVIGRDCEHPANAAQPTRFCHQVGLYILCELPETHRAVAQQCADLSRFLCADPPSPVPLPEPLADGADLLVLGRLVPDGEEVTVDLLDRRSLLPNHLLQAWLQSCLCPLLEEPDPDPDPRPDPELVWDGLLVEMRRLGLDRLPPRTRPATVLGLYLPDPFERTTAVERLDTAGVQGPASFLESDPGLLTRVARITPAEVDTAVKELHWIHRQVKF